MAARCDTDFKVGFAISVYQNSGDPNTNWGEWEKKKRGLFGRSTIRNGDRCGVSTDFWNLYQEDIQRAEGLGATCFRLSLEWSRIEPELGEIDTSAVQRYHDILDLLLSKGMTPFVTLHHFVHPRWFEEMGGFEREGSITHFAQWAQTAFGLFGSKVKYWTTFNEINVASFAGLIYGSFTPGKPFQINACGRQMLHMLRAHTQAYNTIKALPGGDSVLVGLVHSWFTYEPKHCWCITPPYLSYLCGRLNALWGNELTMCYLRTGVFDWNPFWLTSHIKYKEPDGPPGCDFIGLNYYSRGVIDWKLTPTCYNGEVMTDMPYAIYAQGLLPAIDAMSKLGVPIYITETGIADHGDERRPVLIQAYMSQIERAVQAGYDVRGVMYWTLVDNFEWAEGFCMKFGVFEWHPDGSQQRIPRKSAALLEKWFRELPGRVAAHLKQHQGQQSQSQQQQSSLHREGDKEHALGLACVG